MKSKIAIFAEEANEDLRFSEADVHLYAASLGRKKLKWLERLCREELELAKAEGYLNQIYKKLLHKLVYESDFIVDKKTVDKSIIGDDAYVKAKMIFDSQAQVVKFLSDLLKIMENQSFLVNNCVKMILFRNGEV
jgi:hypothetical protein